MSQALLNGNPVFATGGGMAISVVAEWIEKYCCMDIAHPQFCVLNSPENINLTRLRHLDV